ncbi:unnamed protein product [Phaedon cochleariae]|uniref:Uncharacterized protein n=1 Tax=Phaedon cochleariae TaxID=80249 RepID=A0A9N9SGT2_PHACE|nr:unnamed protein product [Phaedon cochleariae]
MAESSGNVVVLNSVNTQKQSSVGQNTDLSEETNSQKDSELPLDTLPVSPPQATRTGTTGPILDLNLNNTNGDSSKCLSFI